jgi:hypothetical protein
MVDVVCCLVKKHKGIEAIVSHVVTEDMQETIESRLNQLDSEFKCHPGAILVFSMFDTTNRKVIVTVYWLEKKVGVRFSEFTNQFEVLGDNAAQQMQDELKDMLSRSALYASNMSVLTQKEQ